MSGQFGQSGEIVGTLWRLSSEMKFTVENNNGQARGSESLEQVISQGFPGYPPDQAVIQLLNTLSSQTSQPAECALRFVCKICHDGEKLHFRQRQPDGTFLQWKLLSDVLDEFLRPDESKATILGKGTNTFRGYIRNDDDFKRLRGDYLHSRDQLEQDPSKLADIPEDDDLASTSRVARELFAAFNDTSQARTSGQGYKHIKDLRYSDYELEHACVILVEALKFAQRGECHVPHSVVGGNVLKREEFDSFTQRKETLIAVLKRDKNMVESCIKEKSFAYRAAWRPNIEEGRKKSNNKTNEVRPKKGDRQGRSGGGTVEEDEDEDGEQQEEQASQDSEADAPADEDEEDMGNNSPQQSSPGSRQATRKRATRRRDVEAIQSSPGNSGDSDDPPSPPDNNKRRRTSVAVASTPTRANTLRGPSSRGMSGGTRQGLRSGTQTAPRQTARRQPVSMLFASQQEQQPRPLSSSSSMQLDQLPTPPQFNNQPSTQASAVQPQGFYPATAAPTYNPAAATTTATPTSSTFEFRVSTPSQQQQHQPQQQSFDQPQQQSFGPPQPQPQPQSNERSQQQFSVQQQRDRDSWGSMLTPQQRHDEDVEMGNPGGFFYNAINAGQGASSGTGYEYQTYSTENQQLQHDYQGQPFSEQQQQQQQQQQGGQESQYTEPPPGNDNVQGQWPQ